MTDAINTQNQVRNTATSADTRAKANTASEQNATQTSDTPAAAIVELNNSQLLQTLNEQIQQSPDVNADRVESIKQALAEGSYQADADTIARKFSDIEKLLQ